MMCGGDLMQRAFYWLISLFLLLDLHLHGASVMEVFDGHWTGTDFTDIPWYARNEERL